MNITSFYILFIPKFNPTPTFWGREAGKCSLYSAQEEGDEKIGGISSHLLQKSFFNFKKFITIELYHDPITQLLAFVYNPSLDMYVDLYNVVKISVYAILHSTRIK